MLLERVRSLDQVEILLFQRATQFSDEEAVEAVEVVDLASRRRKMAVVHAYLHGGEGEDGAGHHRGRARQGVGDWELDVCRTFVVTLVFAA